MGLIVLCLSILLSGGSATDLKVTVKETAGDVYVAVYDSEEAFMNKTYKSYKATVENGSVMLSLDLEPGTYAISVFQDLNGNQELDTNMVGIPKEPYGFSNNAMGMFGPPSFEDSKFEIPSEGYLQIDLH